MLTTAVLNRVRVKIRLDAVSIEQNKGCKVSLCNVSKFSLCIFWGLSVLTQPQLNCLTALLLCFDPSELALCSCRGPLPPPGSASEVGAMRAGSKTGEAQGCKKCSSRTERLGSSLPAITRWFISPTGLISFRPLDIAWIILDQGDTIATYCNAFFPHRADLDMRPVFPKAPPVASLFKSLSARARATRQGTSQIYGHGPTTQHKKRPPPFYAKAMQGDGLPSLNATINELRQQDILWIAK